MIPLNLDADVRASFNAALRAQHRIVRGRVNVLTLAGRHLWDLTGDQLEGGAVTQANPSTDGASRALSVTVSDPRRRYQMDVDPITGNEIAPAAYLFAASYGIWLEDHTRWVWTPIFYGSGVSAVREGHALAIEAQSLERILNVRPVQKVSIAKDTPKITAIRTILASVGQRRFDLGTSTAKMQEPMLLGPFADSLTALAAAAKIARSIGKQLFADARGVVRMRSLPRSTSYRFTDSQIVTTPKVTGDSLEVVNHVHVKGAVKNKKQITANALLPASHGLSKQSLAYGDGTKHWQRSDFIEDDSIGTTAKAQEVADRRLAALTATTAQMTMTALPVPMLEHGDIIDTPMHPPSRWHTGVIPLGGGVMEIGSTRHTYQRRRRR